MDILHLIQQLLSQNVFNNPRFLMVENEYKIYHTTAMLSFEELIT